MEWKGVANAETQTFLFSFSSLWLQLALTGAPQSSEIFLFTDAPAKDDHLRSTILALIESTRSVVRIETKDVPWIICF